MSGRVRVGIIGTGSIADAHLYAYQKAEGRAKIAAVVDVQQDRAARAAERFGVPEIMTDYRTLLARDDIDAVSICTPPSLHVEMSVAALAAGKHVLCEKPVAPTLSDLDRIEQAQKESGSIFSGVFQLRFGKGAQQLRWLLDEGRMGKIHLGMAETLWYRDADYFAVPWRATWADQCGGVTVSQAIHLIDALIWCLGRPTRVYASASTVRALTECEETCVAVIDFENGAIGQITSTVAAAGPEKSRLEVFGTTGSASSTGTAYDSTSEPFAIGMPDPAVAEKLAAEMEEKVPRAYRMLHRGQVEDFLSAIVDARPPAIGVDECRAVLQVTAGIYKSAMTGQAVDLPISPDDPWYNTLVPGGAMLAGLN